jgi:formate dehydrogenase major subunit
MNSTESPVNRLTGSQTDPVTHTPAYKDTSVKMQALAEMGQSPLRKTNHRLGHPTPQRGVEVERKWKRADYRMPGTQRPSRNTDKVSLPTGENNGSAHSF